MKVCFSNI